MLSIYISTVYLIITFALWKDLDMLKSYNCLGCSSVNLNKEDGSFPDSKIRRSIQTQFLIYPY